jgi:putative ABC transport system permease protein
LPAGSPGVRNFLTDFVCGGDEVGGAAALHPTVDSDLPLETVHEESSRHTGFVATDAIQLGLQGRSPIFNTARSECMPWTAFDTTQLRITVRRLGRAPLFTGTAICILGLAVAAITLVSSAFYVVALRPLPFRDPGALTAVWATDGQHRESRDVFDTPTLRAWRSQQSSFSEFSVYEDVRLLAGAPLVAAFSAARVDGHFFGTLGVAPRLGRTIGASDDDASALPVVVLSDRLWRRAFHGDVHAVGSTWRLNTTQYTVVGVMPPATEIPGGEAWVSAPGRESATAEVYYVGIGRLRPGVTVDQAQAQLAAVMPRPDQPGAPRAGALVEPLSRTLRRSSRALTLLMGAVALLVLVAIANLGGLFLVRALHRVKETAIGTALGASAGRIRAATLLEGGTIGLLAAAFGLSAYAWLRNALDTFISTEVIRHAETLPLTAPIVGGASVAAVVTGMLLALSAQRVTGRRNLAATLRGGGAGSQSVRGHTLWRQTLVCLQLASAVVACMVATALERSSRYVAHIDVGYDPGRVVMAPLDIWSTVYGTPQAARQLVDRLGADLASSANGSTYAIWGTAGFPVSTGGADEVFMTAEGSAQRMTAKTCTFHSCAYVIHPASVGLFETFGIPLKAGRFFASTDRAGTPPVAIVTEQAAAVWWPGQSVIGRRIRLGGAGSTQPWITIVGVVGNVAPLNALGRMPRALDPSNIQPLIFEPLAQAHFDEPFIDDEPLFVGIPAGPSLAAAQRELARTLTRTAPDLPISHPISMRAFLESDSIAASLRLPTVVAMVVTAITLLLTMLGIVGVVAQAVRHRIREFGVRLALGATEGGIVRLVCLDATRWLGAGALIGCGATVLCRSLIARVAFQANPSNPNGMLLFGGVHPVAALGIVVPVVVLIAMGAAYLPARAAARLDPLIALRSGNE